MKRVSLPKFIVSFLIVIFAIFLTIYFYPRENSPIQKSLSMPRIDLTPTSTPTDVSQSYLNSPDGTEKLIMKIRPLTNSSSLYSFSVANADGGNSHTIFSATLEKNSSMTIPFNSWSPDNAYVFLQKNYNDTTHIIVLKTSIFNNSPYIDIPTLFAAGQFNYKFQEVTGWASPTLLIVNTKTVSNTKGPSFWFDVQSDSFIQLATKF